MPPDIPAAKLRPVTPRTATAPRSCIRRDRKSTRLNSSHSQISYAVFCLKKKKTQMPVTLCSRVPSNVLAYFMTQHCHFRVREVFLALTTLYTFVLLVTSSSSGVLPRVFF